MGGRIVPVDLTTGFDCEQIYEKIVLQPSEHIKSGSSSGYMIYSSESSFEEVNTKNLNIPFREMAASIIKE
ncbi:MAG TPA: hypothetical protein VJZ03_08435 [Candidatus Bathyarchaeia archaeon]|nr:hypothetical protein [Candidatus Bathyarchaeia archaeon]